MIGANALSALPSVVDPYEQFYEPTSQACKGLPSHAERDRADNLGHPA